MSGPGRLWPGGRLKRIQIQRRTPDAPTWHTLRLAVPRGPDAGVLAVIVAVYGHGPGTAEAVRRGRKVKLPETLVGHVAVLSAESQDPAADERGVLYVDVHQHPALEQPDADRFYRAVLAAVLHTILPATGARVVTEDGDDVALEVMLAIGRTTGGVQ